ncbi:MAG: tyrosine-type recombinase/integrase [Micropruina sp.]|nr:tyrosine-type recombinase/integrase [Micropruina sp.]
MTNVVSRSRIRSGLAWDSCSSRKRAGSILGTAVIVVVPSSSRFSQITRRIHPVAAPTLEARAHSGPSYTTLLDSTLFPGQGGGHIWHSGMSSYFNKAKHAAGRDDLRWHDLRHTGATLAAQVGATTAELQARLGHSTTVAAQLYQHAAKDRDRLISERLSRLVERSE